MALLAIDRDVFLKIIITKTLTLYLIRRFTLRIVAKDRFAKKIWNSFSFDGMYTFSTVNSFFL